MKIISFDVGIKNMAYCIFQVKNNELFIQDWNILNFVKSPENDCCNIKIKGKTSKICGKNAKYFKNNQYFCQTHAKSESKEHSWIIPSAILRTSNLKKQSKDSLIEIGNQYNMFSSNITTKKECLEIIEKVFKERMLEKIVKKKISANDVNLIDVGIQMKEQLNKVDISEITHVIIENQISKIANRMKTVQGMLTQYFIMQENIPHIEYISSFNKLKDLGTKDKENSYKQHKMDSISICQGFIDNNNCLDKWKDILKTTKKDDLADAFLQGVWYMKSKNIISYAENLKINCVTLT
jgi:hypothetical protein